MQRCRHGGRPGQVLARLTGFEVLENLSNHARSGDLGNHARCCAAQRTGADINRLQPMQRRVAGMALQARIKKLKEAKG